MHRMIKMEWSILIVSILLISSTTHASNHFSQTTFTVSHDVKHDVSTPLRDLPEETAAERSLRPLIIHRLRHSYVSSEQRFNLPDMALQINRPLPQNIVVTGFKGVGLGLGNYDVSSIPPDPIGAAGLTQYVQWVNTDYAVFNKATGAVISFPKSGNSIWKNFGGPCETTNQGDPLVRYDQLANRWVLSQFAFEDENNGPFFQCVAVSTSSDATGSYNRYAFQFDSFPDYSKLGIWPDAYYMTFDMFGPVVTGSRACALDRNAMLAGNAASIQCNQLNPSDAGVLLPADLDGQQRPPSTNPEYFLTFIAPNTLRMYKNHVDFQTPSSSTFIGPFDISVANFTIACPNTSGDDCAIQPNTNTRLDTLSDRLMYRLAYRQFSDHASMVVTHTVTGPAPTNAPALRWYELRFNGSSTDPVVYQQSTYAPDSTNRFLGSMAMDKFGNIAIGYSTSSKKMYPSIAFAARKTNDALNTLTLSQQILAGTGSQTGGITRWGDYSSMTIDPVDDCTFWYTNEYLKRRGNFNWSTYIAHFKMTGCTS